MQEFDIVVIGAILPEFITVAKWATLNSMYLLSAH